MSPGYVVNYSH